MKGSKASATYRKSTTTIAAGSKTLSGLAKRLELKIIKLSPAERKIGLSQKALAEDAERQEYDTYRESADGSATLADLFHAKDKS